LKHKKLIVSIAAIALLLVGAVCLTQPLLFKAVLAKHKSTDHFVSLAEDGRIRYENPAKENALELKEILGESQKNVETALKSHFKAPVGVYICSSQDSFNDYVFVSKNVKGAVYWGKVFLSPGAFAHGEGGLADITMHELTHYFFYTHLGEKVHVKNIPLWFREGIAVFVANGAAGYTKDKRLLDLISSAEKEAYLSGATGFWFASEDFRDAVGKNGTANWLLYRVAALFVHYLHDAQPASFDKLIELLLSGTEFSEAARIAYGKGIELLHEDFARYLSADK
jgi:hypothetical protein